MFYEQGPTQRTDFNLHELFYRALAKDLCIDLAPF